MNINTMHISRCRHEIATLLGYENLATSGGCLLYGMPGNRFIAYNFTLDQIIPETLDEASKLPDGWNISINKSETKWTAKAVSWKDYRDYIKSTEEYESQSELEVRFRVRLACILIDKGKLP